MRVVIDTNVLVSGLLSPFGPPGVIAGLITAGRLCPCHDARILAEYNEVLRRSAFPFAEEEVAALMAQIQASGELVAAKPLPLRLPDPDDEPFLEVAAAAMAGIPRHRQPEALSPRLSPRRPRGFTPGVPGHRPAEELKADELLGLTSTESWAWRLPRLGAGRHGSRP